MSQFMNVEVTGKVYSIDPIFSPVGYAKCVFQENLSKVEFCTEGRCLHFKVLAPVEISDVEYFVTSLIPDSISGRKVEVSIKVTN